MESKSLLLAATKIKQSEDKNIHGENWGARRSYQSVCFPRRMTRQAWKVAALHDELNSSFSSSVITAKQQSPRPRRDTQALLLISFECE